MDDPVIPDTPGALTPEWLTRALRSTGSITDARVTSCHIEPFGEGKGFSGQIARIGLRYDTAGPGTPTSLIAKFQLPHPDPDIRAAVFQSRLYEREYRFYRDVARHAALRTPRLYYSVLQPETGVAVLLLEDLAPARTLNMLEGCTGEDAALALRQLATFHAAWWEHPRLGAMDWLPAFDEQAENDQRQYARAWEVFLRKVGDLLPDGVIVTSLPPSPSFAWRNHIDRGVPSRDASPPAMSVASQAETAPPWPDPHAAPRVGEVGAGRMNVASGGRSAHTTATFTQWIGGSASNRDSHSSPPSRPIHNCPVVVPRYSAGDFSSSTSSPSRSTVK